MNKKQILDAIKAVRENSPKRNFKQTVDLLIKLKGIDLKKQDQKVDFFLTLPNTLGKKVKVCGLMDSKLAGKGKEVFDFIVHKDNFSDYKDKKLIKKLTSEYDFFVAQAELMGLVAATFGKVFGPKGKMPNPKAGCVVPLTTLDLKPLYEKLQRSVKVTTKNEISIKVPVGIETMNDDEIVENVEAVYSNLLPKLPHGEINISSVSIKLTMGPFFKLGEGFKVIKENVKVENKK